MDGKTKLDEKKLRAEFEASEVLQAKFGRDIDAYLAFKKADAAGRVHTCWSEEEIKVPRSTANGFWLEIGDPFAGGSLRLYQHLKVVDGLSLPCLLSYKDRDKAPVDEEALRNQYEGSEKLQSEFVDAKSYVKFKGKIVVQVLDNYILRANGDGDTRRGFSCQVALKKCR